MPHRRLSLDPLLLGFPALALLLELLALPAYGWFRDEFYYLACADHLSFGYVDHPPLSILALWLIRGVLGDSLIAVRLVPALTIAVVVYLVGWMAREMGGGRFAQALAMLGAVSAPVYLGVGHIFSMNVFDLLFWALAAALLIRAANGDVRRDWLLLGVVLGLGLQNKLSVLWLGVGLGVGLLATPWRRRLLTRDPWLAAGIALALFLPHIVWQVANGFPTLEFMANATSEKMAGLEIVPFLATQVLIMGPPSVWLWASGLVWLLRPGGRRYRPLAWIWLTVLAILLLGGSARASYLAPSYSWLLAAGGVATEAFLGRRPWGVRLRPALLGLVATGLLLAPFAIPLLPVETYIRYAQALGMEPATDERKELAELPQMYADMHGWDAIVDAVALAVGTLSADERAGAAVFAYNYGVAGAVDRLGRDRELPPAISGHNSYWQWGPGDGVSTLVIVGGRESDHASSCTTVEQVTTVACGRCMPYENGRPVFVCRGLKRPLTEIWPQLKHFN